MEPGQIGPDVKTQAARHNQRHNDQIDHWIMDKQGHTAVGLQNAEDIKARVTERRYSVENAESQRLP